MIHDAHTDNLRVYIPFAHMHTQAQDRWAFSVAVTDYFKVLLGCMVKTPELRHEGEEDRAAKTEEKRIRIEVEMRRKDRKSQRRAWRRREDKIILVSHTILQVLNTHVYQLFDHSCQTTVLVIEVNT